MNINFLKKPITILFVCLHFFLTMHAMQEDSAKLAWSSQAGVCFITKRSFNEYIQEYNGSGKYFYALVDVQSDYALNRYWCDAYALWKHNEDALWPIQNTLDEKEVFILNPFSERKISAIHYYYLDIASRKSGLLFTSNTIIDGKKRIAKVIFKQSMLALFARAMAFKHQSVEHKKEAYDLFKIISEQSIHTAVRDWSYFNLADLHSQCDQMQLAIDWLNKATESNVFELNQLAHRALIALYTKANQPEKVQQTEISKILKGGLILLSNNSENENDSQ